MTDYIAKADAIVSFLNGPECRGSHTRLGDMLTALQQVESPVWWRVFLQTWSGCDRTWPYRTDLLRQLRLHSIHANARAYMDESGGAFFDSLPDLIRGSCREGGGNLKAA